MNKSKSLIYQKESQPLIRHCWVYNIYKKKLSKTSYKEKFVNFLTKDGKKSKAYKLFNKTGIVARRKILQTEKTNMFFENHDEAIQKIKILFIEKNRILQKTDTQNKKYKPSLKSEKIANKGNKNQHSIREASPSLDSLFKSSFGTDKKKILSFNQLVVQAIDNVKPNLEVRKVRIAGTTYLVPAIIPKKRQQTLAIKWLVESARSRKRGTNGSFAESLANELIDAFMKQGQARQKRDDLHKLAEVNRAYTRYRWW
jgi:ribosomal protein S7